MQLAEKNRFPQDARITFDEDTHTYTVDNVKAGISVTGLIGASFPWFDVQAQSTRMVGRHQYRNMSAREIGTQWKIKGEQSSRLGTQMHADIERALNTGVWPDDDRREIAIAKKFVSNEMWGLELYRTEAVIFSEDVIVGGSVDCICRDKDGKYVLFDWKRTQDVAEWAYGEQELGRFKIPNSKQAKYSMQLHMYKYILERWYGLVISKLYIVAFHPNNYSYKKYLAMDFSESVKWYFTPENFKHLVDTHLARKARDLDTAIWLRGQGEWRPHRHFSRIRAVQIFVEALVSSNMLSDLPTLPQESLILILNILYL